MGVTEVAVVGGALCGRGEDGIGFRDADEALWGVGIRGIPVRVMEFGEGIEGSVLGVSGLTAFMIDSCSGADFLISASVASMRTFKTS